MTSAEQGQPDDVDVAQLLATHGAELRRFLWGVLRDAQLVDDVVQIALTKLLVSGGPDRREARKAWLFRVSYHEALAIRRRQAVGDRATRRLAETSPQAHHAADQPLLRQETIERVRQAVGKLPPAQQELVRLRVYENKTFADIARELDLPLGTALSRMRAAMQKLRELLDEGD